MRSSLHLKLNQQLTMTPQLQQAIRLLQLSSQELELEIKTILASNPLLEPVEEFSNHDARFEIPPESEYVLPEVSEAFTDWQTYSNTSQTHKKQDLLLQKSSEATLQQHLLWQMEVTSCSVREQEIALALIDTITEDGYLSSSLSEIQEGLGIKAVELDEIESVLYRIQQLDPRE